MHSHSVDEWTHDHVFLGQRHSRNERRIWLVVALTTAMMVGEIVTMAPNFPASGGSTLTVRALNFLHQFRTEQKTLSFKDKTDSEIARVIVEDINKDLKKKLSKIRLQMLDRDLPVRARERRTPGRADGAWAGGHVGLLTQELFISG